MDHVTERAIALFNYREQATGRVLPCDPNWSRVVDKSFEAAMSGVKGETDQQQCAIQAIRLYLFETGQVQAPWTRAFLPPVKPEPIQLSLAWYRRWWTWLVSRSKSFLKRINDAL